MKLIAKVTKRLSTGNIVEGQEFEATSQDADRLVKMGWAEHVRAKGEQKPGTFQTKPIKAQAKTTAPSSETQEQEPEDSPESVNDAPDDKPDLSSMTKAELLSFAANAGVMVSVSDTKAEIIKQIERGRYNRRDMRPED